MGRLKDMLDSFMQLWQWVQEFVSLKGGLYVDAFAVVILVRLLAPLRGFPSMTPQEAGIWASTILAFGYSNNNGGPKIS